MQRKAPEIPNLLQAHAKKLGLLITADAGHDPEFDCGRFILRCGVTGQPIWLWGLSAEGIANAMCCVELERRLTLGLDAEADEAKWKAAVAHAWHDFAPDFPSRHGAPT